ncbi:iron chelate uptake ABC transporter family permease subunit [Actinobacillus pleuropneumoniae]|uniref:iron chelate uptake ABC transporter family permease subunit n=1 Tax=Actinobacillus pleuropneumoniae TaxID=715 RepID=UPI0024C1F2CC|nr:iron chelate uptake ABC transporter family permease subunit [Actinobacillus pleuropneumoniae]
MSPLLLILAGLVVNLYFGSFSALMMLFYPEESRGLAQWGAGSLVQESWRDSLLLIAQAIPAVLFIGLFIRPLTILALNDANAQSLGVPVAKLRVIGVLIAAFFNCGGGGESRYVGFYRLGFGNYCSPTAYSPF